MTRRHATPTAQDRVLRMQAQGQRMATAAMLGILLTVIALVLRAAGAYLMLRAATEARIEDLQDEEKVMEALLTFMASLGQAGTMLSHGNALLLAGGCLIAYALKADGFRRRWFFWAVVLLCACFIWQPVLGTAFGALWAWLLIANGSEFFPKQAILISR